MAELTNKVDTGTSRKIRSKKLAPKVDLTAMVDLAFLLITFFMLTTSLNKPYSLDVAVPDKSNQSKVDMDERRVVSLLLSEHKMIAFQGDFSKPLREPVKIGEQKNALNQELLKLKEMIYKQTDGKKIMVLIKPSSEATTADIISALDEMKSAKIQHYMISKINKEEENYIVAR